MSNFLSILLKEFRDVPCFLFSLLSPPYKFPLGFRLYVFYIREGEIRNVTYTYSLSIIIDSFIRASGYESLESLFPYLRVVWSQILFQLIDFNHKP